MRLEYRTPRTIGWFHQGFKAIGFEDMGYISISKQGNAQIGDILPGHQPHQENWPELLVFENNINSPDKKIRV